MAVQIHQKKRPGWMESHSSQHRSPPGKADYTVLVVVYKCERFPRQTALLCETHPSTLFGRFALSQRFFRHGDDFHLLLVQ
ncbi:MAG: hypothetical protein K2X27_20455 [Candidatus Obscuribacterales bacterium]|nr:hypothetical protein [Candidatus Obscuribacterales bacterium]